MENIQPEVGKTDQRPDEPKPKKHHRLRWFLISIVIIVVILAMGVAATGVYRVPVISSVFGMGAPKDLGVKTSTEALKSIEAKIPLDITGEAVSYSGNAAEAFSGEIPIDTQTTSEEITSWLERFEGSDPLFTDTQVKKFEGGLEISTMLQKYVKAPVYVKVMIDQTGTNTIALDITKAKLGMFTVPEKYIDQAETWFEDQINDGMASVPGFRMDAYAIHDDYSTFKGTFPETARPSTHGWSDLLNL